MGLLGLVVTDSIDALDLKCVGAKLVADETDEQAVDVAADRGFWLDDADAPAGVEGVRRLEAHFGFAMQALGGQHRQQQGGLDTRSVR